MIKRTVEISTGAVHVSVRNAQLCVTRKNETETSTNQKCPGGASETVPLEDIGLLVVDELGSTVSIAALSELAEHGAAVCICGHRHLPAGLLLPFNDRHETVRRVHDQIAAGRPTKKRLWRQIVRAKILAQSRNLSHDAAAAKKLRLLREAVKSGDPTNIEAQASRVYWARWLGRTSEFRRIASPIAQGPPPNDLLDYGYAVLRAAVARALVSAGLMPLLGIHHEHRSNPFCLADDLLEPLRPIVDSAVRGLYRSGVVAVTRESKEVLLGLLTTPVRVASASSPPQYTTGPLMVALARYVASLVECLPTMRRGQKLAIPTVNTTAAYTE